MNEVASTRVLAPLLWHDPRVQRLDDTWLLTIFALALAVAVPWVISGRAADLAAAAIGLLGVGAIHVGFAVLCSPAAPKGLRSTRVLAAWHALGIIALGLTWARSGGLQNPLFLIAFVPPVIGAIFLSRWQPYLMAVLAGVVVALIAASEAPELRWYAPGLGAMAGWLGAVLGSAAGSTGLSFAGFYAPSQYYVVLLVVFVILLFGCAVVAEYFGTILERLDARVSAARAEALRSQRLWHTLLEQLPVAAVLVDADTHEVTGASRAALAKFFGGEDPGAGCDFFETIHFTYPEPIQRLVHGAGGVEPLSMLRLGDRLLATEIRVQHVAQKGRRFALVIVHDMTEGFCVKAALDVSDHAALVADGAGRVLAFNKPARALFPDAAVGATVPQLLPQTTAGARWWDPGLSGRRRLYATVMRRVYQVTASAVVLPGEDTRLYVIAFLPAARVAAGDAGVTGSTTVLQRQ